MVPVTPEEIAADAVTCAKVGTSIIHIHVRVESGTDTKEVKRSVNVRNLR